MATVVQYIPPLLLPLSCACAPLLCAILKLIPLYLNKSYVCVGARSLMKNKNKLFLFCRCYLICRDGGGQAEERMGGRGLCSKARVPANQMAGLASSRHKHELLLLVTEI